MTAVVERRSAEGDREAEKGRVALKGFFRVTEEWGCSAEERAKLLGGPSRTTLYNYSKLNPTKLSNDTMERISYMLGIYKALQVLYPTHERANRRIRLKTTEVPFCGKSAMEFMTQGSMMNLMMTRQYFDAKRGW
ncbi:MAG: antitoxin Xre-like helix-turn-helix domain-containing protein [Marinobacter sp.]